jgi:hypothetical protein
VLKFETTIAHQELDEVTNRELPGVAGGVVGGVVAGGVVGGVVAGGVVGGVVAGGVPGLLRLGPCALH